jgi:hypothetical protein
VQKPSAGLTIPISLEPSEGTGLPAAKRAAFEPPPLLAYRALLRDPAMTAYHARIDPKQAAHRASTVQLESPRVGGL